MLGMSGIGVGIGMCSSARVRCLPFDGCSVAETLKVTQDFSVAEESVCGNEGCGRRERPGVGTIGVLYHDSN